MKATTLILHAALIAGAVMFMFELVRPSIERIKDVTDVERRGAIELTIGHGD